MPAKETEKKPTLKQIGLSQDILLGLYRCLTTSRLLDERFRKLFRQGRYAGTYFSAVGQEACTVGACYGLRDEDIVGPSHREIGAAVTKGMTIPEMVAQVYARRTSPDKGKTHPCHYGSRKKGVITPASTVAGQAVVATGCAMAFKIQKRDNIAIAFFGEGATARGGWHEALNFAGIHKLPIIYFCQNNLWAESVPATLQGAIKQFADRALAYGFPGVTIDGNDVVEVYKTTQDAVRKARNGEGPTFIEAMTYRWYGHSEIDPADYRTKEEVEYWKARDPILRHEKLLTDLGLLSPDEREAIVEDIESAIDEAVKETEATPYAEPEEAYLDVYSPEFPVRREE
jgi:acetoin:2,6-dichlorophenolindophenol oxidoreductase subunit alpha